MMTPKLRSAVELRDAAWSKLRVAGTWEDVDNLEGQKVWAWKDPRVCIFLRTPFLELPNVGEAAKYRAALSGKRIKNLDYGLDIWDLEAKRKVLNIEWNDEGAVELVSFRRGSWESYVLGLQDPPISSADSDA